MSSQLSLCLLLPDLLMIFIEYELFPCIDCNKKQQESLLFFFL
ncbi:hypothetical protein STRDD11_01816 [Streptococcus sp. DD11]|nr:hypothetical protein STRDD11_01816 [Streptococcus sp. DD11]